MDAYVRDYEQTYNVTAHAFLVYSEGLHGKLHPIETSAFPHKVR